MPAPPVPLDKIKLAIAAVEEQLKAGAPPPGRPVTRTQVGAIKAASYQLGEDDTTVRHWLKVAKRTHNLEPDWSLWTPPPIVPTTPDDEALSLRDRCRMLETELKSRQREEMTREAIRRYVLGLKEQTIEQPKWLSAKPVKGKHTTGVPTLLCSDWHWGEVVKPSEVNWANEYNLEIAHDRARKLVDTSLSLLFDRLHDPNYPGAVICLGGDMLSGNIHEELTATNDAPIMPCVVDLIGVLRTVIDRYLERFPRLYIPCVTGNHGRMTRKPVAKERNATNFDWLIYQMLALHYAKDSRVAFNIPDGADCYFNIYGHRYCLTHGDQFRGGDGITGAIMPIIRGRHKKSSRDTSIGQPWDTIVMGHWHTLIQLPHAIVNACFPPGQRVFLADGTDRPIEDVKVGDLVATHLGRTRPVVDLLKRDYTGDLINIRMGTNASDFACTPNHGIWAIKGNMLTQRVPMNGKNDRTSHESVAPGWVPAEHLSPGDYISAPVPSEAVDPDIGDADFYRLIGWYIAEGSASGRNGKLHHLDFTLARKEASEAEFIAEQCVRRWGSGKVALQRARPSVRAVACYRAAAAEEMVALCGKGAATKALCPAIMTAPPDLQLEILVGWLAGDGHTAKRTYRGGRLVSGTTISKTLALQLRQIAIRCGFSPSLYCLAPGENGRRKNIAWTLGFTAEDAERLSALLNEDLATGGPAEMKVARVGGKPFYRITHVWRTPYSGPVHNLTVAEDHSYVVNGWGVRNSLKGLDEYAYQGNFGFERAAQALWITHPDNGITFQMPVYVDERREAGGVREWVSWPKAA